jgi:hypothetical protein
MIYILTIWEKNTIQHQVKCDHETVVSYSSAINTEVNQFV